MQYFTGSKEHNILLRSRALKLGLTLNEYGLFRIDDETRVAGETEEEVYAALGLAWIPPELRENCGEIEAALEDRLPKLIELSDIRGDLHMHTTETDGRATLQEMAEAAHALGYEYIAITDHSKALAMANGLDEKRAVAFAQQVRDLNRSGLPLRVFSGLECDIRRDGDDGSGRRRAGRARHRHRQRSQPHESRSRGDDGSPDARPRIAFDARDGPSHRPHSAESRSVSIRL